MIGSEHALVAEVKAQLADARLNLEWTRIYAPANGYVTNVQLRDGSYAYAGKPVLTFIDAEQWWVVANYRENCLERIRAGQPVGLTFNTYPGRVFSGTVQSVGWGVDEGQGVPSGVGRPHEAHRGCHALPVNPQLPRRPHVEEEGEGEQPSGVRVTPLHDVLDEG